MQRDGTRPSCYEKGVDDGFAARAEARRKRGMWGGVARSHEEADERDLEFWLTVDGAQRIAAIYVLLDDLQGLTGDGPFPRLSGSPGGVRRLGS
jgi:hypothetical protein